MKYYSISDSKMAGSVPRCIQSVLLCILLIVIHLQQIRSGK